MTIPEGSVGILKLAESAELLRLTFSLRWNGLWSQSRVFAFLLHHVLAVTLGQACSLPECMPTSRNGHVTISSSRVLG